ncbi:MAG TPA: isoprenylcysteine carboxylmethyltransferase family protein [Rhodocyclaceae bacterium]|jgi:protein-S-isoprenylcysteine O-methyltransferase Ste14
MSHDDSGYGLWSLVVINSVFFILFAASFFKPSSRRDWRTLGMFSAFIVALFSEMYGFPLTIYLLSGWLTEKYPEINWLSHDAGHLPEMLFGWRGNPHFGPFHILSNVFVLGGFWLLAKAWPVLYQAQKTGKLASTGPYARIRHPQYAAFILVMVGFLFQWPTIVTLVLFPVLVTVYVRLARSEESMALQVFKEEYQTYMAKTPGWWPKLIS